MKDQDDRGCAAHRAVVNEFAGATLGDLRRNRRLEEIVLRLAKRPEVGFPRAMETEADLQGFYRFLRNEAVSFQSLLDPHTKATVARMSAQTEVLAVHDTTELRFTGARQGLGRLVQSGHGFHGHFTLAVAADGTREPLGVLAVESWVRLGPTPSALRVHQKLSYRACRLMPSEQDRWVRSIDAAQAVAGAATSLIHVMDSEADDYAIMARLVEARGRWVIRLCRDRRLAGGASTPARKAKEAVAQRRVVCQRTVKLSRRRRHPGGHKDKRVRVRKERLATLAMSAVSVILRRPDSCPDGPATLPVNIVSVREISPPADDEPVEWLLVTTEPIETEEQILQVVDYYRGRWVIEEYFKALKTGCSFEKRQLESWDTLLKALGLLIPVAWNLLRLRTLARGDPDRPARTVLAAMEIEVLRRVSQTPLPKKLTVHDAMLAIARLAGHQRRNGEPGWQLLGYGYQDLLLMVAGYKLAQEEK